MITPEYVRSEAVPDSDADRRAHTPRSRTLLVDAA